VSLTTFKRRAEAVHYEGETFEKLDLRSMKAFGSQWKNCVFNNCKLDLADWRASKFERALFQNCSMRLVNFATSLFEDALFSGCDLEQASFMGSHFRGGGFRHSRMTYGETMFQDATVKGDLWFEDCNLHGSNLDFREVEPKALRFDDCNLWGVKVGMACEFWNSSVDDRTVRQFLALVARVADDPRIAELAGDQMAVVTRAMDGGATCHSTKVSATTSTPIPVSPVQTATIPTPILKAMMRTD
jgi:hypothetical protein